MKAPPTPAERELWRRQSAAERRARRRAVMRRRLLALVVVAAVVGVLIAAFSSGASKRPLGAHHRLATRSPGSGQDRSGNSGKPAAPRPKPVGPFAVGVIQLQLVDHTRSIPLPGGATEPRPLTTEVLYPASRPGSGTPERAGGPFPLIVFGHGFAVTPGYYAQLLHAWARAGYVVAAPTFPLTNLNAPGGPNESDLLNQPADVRFVISQMLSASSAPSGRLSGLIAQHEIAVAGQSDGGDTALAVADDPPYRDPRVGAAVILSGAEIPSLPAFTIHAGGPALLATQGTADPINQPGVTSAFYDPAPAPKFLLELLGASHLPPYETEQPQLGIVERVTIAFLNHYLRHAPQSLAALRTAGNVTGVATLNADP